MRATNNVTERELAARAEGIVAAWNRHDVDSLVTAFHPDARLRGLAGGEMLCGREAVRADAETLLRALPDLRFEVRRTIPDGLTVAQEWTIRATHTSGLFGIAATGRTLQQSGVSVVDYNPTGLITAFARYWNLPELIKTLRQA
jgi:steroid delta-isomerase-like uncharacterized protein